MNGEFAEVESVDFLSAPDGGTYTTYNFEVADFHTYFVGNYGALVHNSGRTPCEKALSIFKKWEEQKGGDIWTALKEYGVFVKAAKSRVRASDIKVLNEVRRRHFAEGELFRPLWEVIAGQDLVAGSAGSSRKLASNICKAFGIENESWFAAHHIVPKGDQSAKAKALRAILEKFNVHIDEAANGTFMVAQQTYNDFEKRGLVDILDGLGPKHKKHTQEYVAAVFERLKDFQNIQASAENSNLLRRELQMIAKDLINGAFEW